MPFGRLPRCVMPSWGRDAAPESDPSGTAFKWDCPYCGESSVDRYAGTAEEVERAVVAALRTHIVSSDGGGHGTRNEAPADRTRTLFEYVGRAQPCDEG